MFNLKDMGTFIWAFFLTLPSVALIHATGRIFFAKLFGGKVSVELGKGRQIFSVGILKLRLLYFVCASGSYDELKINNRLTQALVHAGGMIFNAISILLVNWAIYAGFFPKHMFFYQFVYFSLYYIFFDILPVDYGNGQISEGKALWNIWKNGAPDKND